MKRNLQRSRSILAAVAALVVWTAWPAGAQAAALCNPNSTYAVKGSTGDVTINSIEASSCQYFGETNDSEAVLNAGSGFAGVTTWDAQWKEGADKNASGPLQLSLENLNVAAGTVELSWTGGPGHADLAFIVKASNEFFAYFFDHFHFHPGAAGSYDSAFAVKIYNANGGVQDLSHLSIYTANAHTCPDHSCGTVPTPATLALLGLGALGLGLARRRKAQ